MIMNNKSDNNDLFRKAIVADCPDLKPDRNIESNLNYYFMLKNPSRKVQSNSFVGLLVWLISFKDIGLKAGFASACLAGFLFFGSIKNEGNVQYPHDTCQVSTPLLVDTFYTTQDSCK